MLRQNLPAKTGGGRSESIHLRTEVEVGEAWSGGARTESDSNGTSSKADWALEHSVFEYIDSIHF